ncbi:MAG: hypothetical protein LKG27_01095 [Clostridiaceae bacterium]|jgi:hypothetical protein|nr:hypothetical protein [Clostridiaceae bacterium]
MAKKKNIWKLEYTVTLFIIVSIVLILLPVSLGGTMQANLISKWNERFNRVEYMASVIKANMDLETEKTFEKAKPEDKDTLVLQLLKPYLRIDTSRQVPRHYRQRYMDRTRVLKGQEYYFSDVYYAENNVLVGIKYLKPESKDEPNYMMMFDLNGILPPNTWGKDIFGVDIYSDMSVKPFGDGMSMDALSSDCSPKGTGVMCSYYYKIGGAFDDKK